MSVLATELKKMYWQQSGRYNPIIRDGLVVYEPFDVYREKTLVGGWSIPHNDQYATMSQDGIRCSRGVDIFYDLSIKEITCSSWIFTVGGRCHYFIGYYDSISLCMYASNQTSATSIEMRVGSSLKTITKPAGWFNFAFRRNSSNAVTAYLNGTAVGQWTNYSPSIPKLRATANGGPDSGAHSLVAGFRVYNRALSDSEIAALAHEFTPTT